MAEPVKKASVGRVRSRWGPAPVYNYDDDSDWDGEDEEDQEDDEYASPRRQARRSVSNEIGSSPHIPGGWDTPPVPETYAPEAGSDDDDDDVYSPPLLKTGSESAAGYRKSLSIDTNTEHFNPAPAQSQEDSLDSSIPSSVAGFEYKGLNRLSMVPDVRLEPPQSAGAADEPAMNEADSQDEYKRSSFESEPYEQRYSDYYGNSTSNNYSSELSHTEDNEGTTDTESRAESSTMYNYDTYERALATDIDVPIQHNLENLSLSRPLDSSVSSSEASSFVERPETRASEHHDKRASYALSRAPYEQTTSSSAGEGAGLVHSGGLLSIHERNISVNSVKSESELLTEHLLETLNANLELKSRAEDGGVDPVAASSMGLGGYEDDHSSSTRTAMPGRPDTEPLTDDDDTEDAPSSVAHLSPRVTETSANPYDLSRRLQESADTESDGYENPYANPYESRFERPTPYEETTNPYETVSLREGLKGYESTSSYDPATRPPIPETHPVEIDEGEGASSVPELAGSVDGDEEAEMRSIDEPEEGEAEEYEGSTMQSDSNSIAYSDAHSYPQQSNDERSQSFDYEIISAAATMPLYNFKECMKEKNISKRRDMFEAARTREREFDSGIQQWLMYMKEQRQDVEPFAGLKVLGDNRTSSGLHRKTSAFQHSVSTFTNRHVLNSKAGEKSVEMMEKIGEKSKGMLFKKRLFGKKDK
ncbi:hypothetical protein BZA70DRAFT_297494 [Myxozyma melibiosi]|uniref:Fcf2 pre-rRNA processing C-terminal domain-containing protein n=1 Tax=Myxozyma melibiosi TaxID=54550 RepID=A0ABR1EZM0_9ASCO